MSESHFGKKRGVTIFVKKENEDGFRELPGNYPIIPVRVLEKPEPIEHRKPTPAEGNDEAAEG